MIKWLCVCFWIHVIPTQQSLTTSSFWCICMYLVVYYVYVVNLCLWRHNLKKCVITLKVHNVKTFVMSSKVLSWRQQHVMTSTTRHDVKSFIITSKSSSLLLMTKFIIKWREKKRNNVTKFVMTSQCLSWRHQARHGIKNTPWRQKVCHDVTSLSWSKKYVMMSKGVSWSQQYVIMLNN